MEVCRGFADSLCMLADADLGVHTDTHPAWPVEGVSEIWPVERTAHGDKKQCSQVVCLLQPTHTGQRAGAERGDGVLPV